MKIAITTKQNVKDFVKPLKSKQSIEQFYEHATEDYKFWSKNYNMHFGYSTWGCLNPFKREPMLTNMNKHIFDLLELKPRSESIVMDLGCGMGGSMNYGMRRFPRLSMLGVTLSDFQVDNGNKFIGNYPGLIVKENFKHLSSNDNVMDGAIAVESFCHSGHHKDAFKEAYRVLKPGASLVIADAFLKQNEADLNLSSQWVYKNLCSAWSLKSLKDIDQVQEELKDIGFKNIKIENLFWRVASSVLHVPFAIGGFVIKSKLKGKVLKQEQINNLKGSFFALLSGLHLKSFGYYIIKATK